MKEQSHQQMEEESVDQVSLPKKGRIVVEEGGKEQESEESRELRRLEKAKRVKLRKTERKLEKEESRDMWYKSLSEEQTAALSEEGTRQEKRKGYYPTEIRGEIDEEELRVVRQFFKNQQLQEDQCEGRSSLGSCDPFGKEIICSSWAEAEAIKELYDCLTGPEKADLKKEWSVYKPYVPSAVFKDSLNSMRMLGADPHNWTGKREDQDQAGIIQQGWTNSLEQRVKSEVSSDPTTKTPLDPVTQIGPYDSYGGFHFDSDCRTYYSNFYSESPSYRNGWGYRDDVYYDSPEQRDMES